VIAAAKGVIVAAAVALGVLFAFGSVLSALFEAQGFGDRDSDPRMWYLVAMGAAFVACVAVPVAVWRVLLPRSAPAFPLAAVVAAAGVVLILGISIR
jgi:branched-subunit amino acid ABC-type transport system permease component